jgi:hypothetical protein
MVEGIVNLKFSTLTFRSSSVLEDFLFYVSPLAVRFIKLYIYIEDVLILLHFYS